MLFKFLPVHAPFQLDNVHYVKWCTGQAFRTDNGMIINIPNSMKVEVPYVLSDKWPMEAVCFD
jgi:hypothetical protein